MIKCGEDDDEDGENDDDMDEIVPDGDLDDELGAFQTNSPTINVPPIDIEDDEEDESSNGVCNMSRFKMQQEEIRFQQITRSCQAWIEVLTITSFEMFFLSFF